MNQNFTVIRVTQFAKKAQNVQKIAQLGAKS